jgi:hypothetical protein
MWQDGVFTLHATSYPVGATIERLRSYWAGLITLAKVMKVEIGKPHDFDRPSSRDEAL